MNRGTPQLSSLKRTLAMLDAVIADGGHSNLAELARKLEHGGFAAGRDETISALAALEADYTKVAAALTTMKDTPHG